MKFMEALTAINGHSTKYISHSEMVSDRHCYVRVQGLSQALKLVNFKTTLEQDWVPSLNDLLRADWQVLE